jgi:hypothetical protein
MGTPNTRVIDTDGTMIIRADCQIYILNGHIAAGDRVIRDSRFLRAIVLTTWLYSFLLWLYIAARIVTYDYIVFDPFVYAIPWLSFGALGAFSFLLSAAAMFTYFYVWGFSRERRA